MIRYHIAKYVDDIGRNEPINVGVLVSDGSQTVMRFEGEDARGRMDKRRVRRSLISGRDAYVGWVNYWRRAAQDRAILPDGPEDVLERLSTAGARDFYIEPGGTIVLDLDQRPLDEVVGDLYARLVKPEDPQAPPTLQEKSLRVLREAGADPDDTRVFKRNVPVSIEVGDEKFTDEVSYAVKNGSWHYVQEVSFDSQRIRSSRKEATHCAFVFEHGKLDGDKAIIYEGDGVDAAVRDLVRMLERFAPAVDVDRPVEAAEILRGALHLG